MPDADRLRAVARRWVLLWNAPVDWAAFDAIHHPDFEDRSSAGRPSDKQGFAQGLRDFVSAFPDVVTTLEDLVVDPSTGQVAVRWRAVGTNRSRYLGIGPTGRRTVITGIEIIRIDGERVIRRWGEWDINDHRDDPPREARPHR